MSNCKLLTVVLASFLAATNAMPQTDKDQNDDGSFLFGIPFLQLTNGGVRVNFAGYHAEAGLGGLLGGKTAGGLHASAGTPWGAHARAGLGGILGGDDASAGGGLYARAGLGPGMPEAGAGLGGMLDGSGRSAAPISGGLFAGATTGDGGFQIGDIGMSASNNPPSSASASSSSTSDANVSTEKPKRGRTNIQIISRSKKHMDKRSEGGLVESSVKEVQGEVYRAPGALSAGAGLFGAVYAGPKGNQDAVLKAGGIEPANTAPLAPPLPSSTNEVHASRNANEPAKDVTSRSGGTRWRFRKRFWTGVPRKQVIYEAASDDLIPTRRMSMRSAQGDAPSAGRINPHVPPPPPENNRDTFFDDIFNIPQSTLTAVSGFLTKNIG